MADIDTPVLVCGAGPTGLMLACQQARFGVGFRLIDRNPGPSLTSKAMVVHARTLELYAQLGLAEEAIAAGQRAEAVEFHAGGRYAAQLAVGDIGAGMSPYPFVLALGQDANERLLSAWLARRGIAVEWNTTLTGLAQDAAGVTARVATPAGESTIRAGWVAGCDGAHSAARHSAGIGFPGERYAQEFFVADIDARGALDHRHLNVFIGADGFHLLFPMAGEKRYRLIGIIPAPLRERADTRFEEIAAAVTPFLTPGFTIDALHWWSRYRISHRVAERFRAGRVFLLGDAGHIHSPAGGQGMNTGLQDAANLGWKLAFASRGLAGETLLASYGAERERVAQRLVATTDRAFTLAVSPNRFARLARGVVAGRALARLTRIAALRRLAFRTVSQIGIRYRASPLSREVGDFDDSPVRAGDRLPWLHLNLAGEGGANADLHARLGGEGLHLLLMGAAPDDVARAQAWAAAAPWPARCHVATDDVHNRAALERAGLAVPLIWLVRPDGYLGLVARNFDTAALTDWIDAARA
jgi:2-polyprenyl-6-methoxyphenol hydroxylase-like FAD-dependent oxidoreductase